MQSRTPFWSEIDHYDFSDVITLPLSEDDESTEYELFPLEKSKTILSILSSVTDQFHALYKKQLLVPEDGWISENFLYAVEALLRHENIPDLKLNFFDTVREEKIKFNRELFQVCLLKWCKDKQKMSEAEFDKIKLDTQHTFFIFNKDLYYSWIENDKGFFPFHSLKKSDPLHALLNSVMNQKLKCLVDHYIENQKNVLIERINKCDFSKETEMHLFMDWIIETIPSDYLGSISQSVLKSLLSQYPAECSAKFLMNLTIHSLKDLMSYSKSQPFLLRKLCNHVIFETTWNKNDLSKKISYFLKTELVDLIRDMYVRGINLPSHILNKALSWQDKTSNNLLFDPIEKYFFHDTNKQSEEKIEKLKLKNDDSISIHNPSSDDLKKIWENGIKLSDYRYLKNKYPFHKITQVADELLMVGRLLTGCSGPFYVVFLSENIQELLIEFSEALQFSGQEEINELCKEIKSNKAVIFVDLEEDDLEDSLKYRKLMIKEKDTLLPIVIFDKRNKITGLYTYYKEDKKRFFDNYANKKIKELVQSLNKMKNELKESPLTQGQNSLINPMKALNLKKDDIGVCFGFSVMAIITHLLEDYEVFNNRLRTLHFLMQKGVDNFQQIDHVSLDLFDKEDKKDVLHLKEIATFLSLLNMMQDPAKYKQFFTESYFDQSIKNILEVLPINLNHVLIINPKMILFAEEDKFLWSNTLECIEKIFNLLLKKFSECQYPIAFLLNIQGFHAISVGYSKKRWSLADANSQPIKQFKEVRQIATAVFSALSFKKEYIGKRIVTDICISSKNEQNFKEMYCPEEKIILEKCFDKKNEDDFRYLITCLQYGAYGIKKNLTQAASLVIEEAQKGFPPALHILFNFYSDGLESEIKQDYLKALECCEKGIIQGAAWAKTELPRALNNAGCAHGRACYGATKKNAVEAVKYFLRSAELGYTTAQYNLTSYYEEGIGGLEKNLLLALECYQKSAAQGDSLAIAKLPIALNNAGYAYDTASCGAKEKNLSTAAEYFRESAKLGNASAQHNLAHYYEEGKGGLEKNCLLALECYQKSAAQGDSLAIAKLSIALNNAAYAHETGSQGATEKNVTKAVECFRKAARKGSVAALHHLATYYSSEKNFSLALEYYQKTIAHDESKKSSATLAEYLYGAGAAEKNVTKKAEYLRQSADLGYAPAQYDLSAFYAKGMGVEQNILLAVKYCQKAADQKHKDAIDKLPLLLNDTKIAYQQGCGGVEKNNLLALEYCQKVVNKSEYPEYLYKAGVAYELGCWGATEKNFTKAAEFFRRSAESVWSIGLFSNSAQREEKVVPCHLLNFSLSGVREMEQKCQVFLTECRQTAAHSNSCGEYLYKMGVNYDADCEKGIQIARELYWESARLGYAIAQYDVANRYYKGIGIRKDLPMAAEYCRNAANQGESKAITELPFILHHTGVAYQKGSAGVREVDHMMAMKFFREAADKGLAVSQYNVALYYRSHRDIKNDCDKNTLSWFLSAITYLQRAAAQRHEGAATELRLMLNERSDEHTIIEPIQDDADTLSLKPTPVAQ